MLFETSNFDNMNFGNHFTLESTRVKHTSGERLAMSFCFRTYHVLGPDLSLSLLFLLIAM